MAAFVRSLTARLPRRAGRLLLIACLLTCASAFAAVPELRELWVPSDRLAQVLARHPRAVFLSRAQYETLVQDARAGGATEPALPLDAALLSADYQARLGKDVALVMAVLQVQVLGRDWVRLPLKFPGATLGHVEVTGAGGLTLPGADASGATLLLRGRGSHSVKLEFSLPVKNNAEGSHLEADLPRSAAAAFRLDLPGTWEVTGSTPVHLENGGGQTHAVAALPTGSDKLSLNWQPRGEAMAPLAPQAESRTTFVVDAQSVRTETVFTLSAPVGNLPARLEWEIPGDAQAEEVSGAEIGDWEAAPGKITATLVPGHHSEAEITVKLRQPALEARDEAHLRLALPALAHLRSHAGTLHLTRGEGVLVREVRAPGLIPAPVAEGETEVGEWSFDPEPRPIEVRVQRLRPHFTVDLDTLADFRRDAIFLERTVTLHEAEGELFALTITLPAEEEVLEVKPRRGAAPEWRREGPRLFLHWNTAAGSEPRSFTVSTRRDPPGWANLSEPGKTIPLGDARVEGAEHVTGYIALRAAEDLRLEATPSDTLEPRDGRTTPVRGTWAWFRRDEYTLAVRASRRPAELLATVTGYALPLAGGLDVHAQIAWNFRFSGVRSVQVRVPGPIAGDFEFSGAGIASRTLKDDVWTITFQNEVTGQYSLLVEAHLPIERSPEEKARFTVDLPLIEPLGVQRVEGTWAVEANTDTEIEVSTEGTIPLDALQAPEVPLYTPRHRVIGVYHWVSPRHRLHLTGTRHAGAEVLTTVVDSLDLRTVLTPAGVARTDVRITLRTTGQQFLDVTLPPRSTLLSLLSDCEPIKPVAGPAGGLRVQLSDRSQNGPQASLQILYETAPARPWGYSGRGTLAPLRLPASVPVLHSTWLAWMPASWFVSRWQTNLQNIPVVRVRPLILLPLTLYDGWSALGQLAVLGSSGISDPRAFHTGEREGRIAERWQAQKVQPFARPGESTSPDFSADAGSITRAMPAATPAPAAAPEPAPDAPPPGKTVQEKLERIVVPRVEFREASVREALDFIQHKSRERDTDPDPGNRGVRIVLSPTVDQAALAELRITLSLTNIALGDLLRYATSLVNLKFRVAGDHVEVAPQGYNTESLITKMWVMSPDFLPDLAADPASNTPREIRERLTNNYGVTFPPGSSAVYLPQTRKLIVKNTQENLDLIDAVQEAGKARAPQRVAGLLPMRLDLPLAGEQLSFAGLSHPEEISFHYTDSVRRSRHLWLLFASGALGYAFFSGPRPWRRTAWVILALSAVPLCVDPETAGVCNALLAGWLLALFCGRLGRRWLRAGERKEVTA